MTRRVSLGPDPTARRFVAPDVPSACASARRVKQFFSGNCARYRVAACYRRYIRILLTIAVTIEFRLRRVCDGACYYSAADLLHHMDRVESAGKCARRKNAALDDAWRTVLSDPDYAQRRQHEERKLYEARNRK